MIVLASDSDLDTSLPLLDINSPEAIADLLLWLTENSHKNAKESCPSLAFIKLVYLK